MKFSGELKFPEIDHPGVPVDFIIEESQAELFVGGESLGRWSLYDVHARRLVASAFQIDLDGNEVTFVADDPIDFAYRGVEHMAEAWAKIKSKGLATRSLAVRKSRKGTSPSRIEDMKSAMVSNLETVSGPRPIAGEVPNAETPAEEPSILAEDVAGPGVSDEASTATPVAEPDVDAETLADERLENDQGQLAEERKRLEEQRRQLAEERARFEEERRVAEQREADRIEAYRLEMRRLEAEREALGRRAREIDAGDVIEADAESPGIPAGEKEEPAFTDLEREEVPETAAAGVVEDTSEGERVPAADDQPEIEKSLQDEPDEEAVPRGVAPEDTRPEEASEAEEAQPEEAPEQESEPEPGLVDLSGLEEPEPPPPAAPAPLAPAARGGEDPEPAMAGATRDRSGLMGAVRAAFRSGSKDHEHQFIEAPGGIGITRYVCEECGYVSISV